MFQSSLFEIRPEWIDYNNHFNMGYYAVLFDLAADEAYADLGFGPDYKTHSGHTTYSAEFHICYLRELKLGDQVRANFRIIDFDEKRFHSYQEMIHRDGWIAATGEGLTLHVDTSGPKVAPMPADIQKRLSDWKDEQMQLPKPSGIGQGIEMIKK